MTPTEMKTKCPNSMDGLDPRKKRERERDGRKSVEEGQTLLPRLQKQQTSNSNLTAQYSPKKEFGN